MTHICVIYYATVRETKARDGTGLSQLGQGWDSSGQRWDRTRVGQVRTRVGHVRTRVTRVTKSQDKGGTRFGRYQDWADVSRAPWDRGGTGLYKGIA
eukprot:1336189-Amorphochlora_amoeboformis.AAC.1